MSNYNCLRNNIPDWLFSYQATGKHNPAALEADDMLAREPVKKKIILDFNSCSFYTEQIISILMELGFDIYYFDHEDKLNKLSLLTQSELWEESSIIFNSTAMWQTLFKHGFNRKDCVALGVTGNISANDFLNYWELFVDIFEETVPPDVAVELLIAITSYDAFIQALPRIFEQNPEDFVSMHGYSYTRYQYIILQMCGSLETRFRNISFMIIYGIKHRVNIIDAYKYISHHSIDDDLKIFALFYSTLSALDYPNKKENLSSLLKYALTTMHKRPENVIALIKLELPVFDNISILKRSQAFYFHLYEAKCFSAITFLQDKIAPLNLNILPLQDFIDNENYSIWFIFSLLQSNTVSIKEVVLKSKYLPSNAHNLINQCDETTINFLFCAKEFSESEENKEFYKDNQKCKELFLENWVAYTPEIEQLVIDNAIYATIVLRTTSLSNLVAYKESFEHFVKNLERLEKLLGIWDVNFRSMVKRAQYLINKQTAFGINASTPQQQRGAIYGGQQLSSSVISDTAPRKELSACHNVLYFACYQRGEEVTVPSWMQNLSRMAITQVFQYDGQKFILQNSQTLTYLPSQEELPIDEEHYQLAVKTENLRKLPIGNNGYVIPITHPHILFSYYGGEVYQDNLGRYILQTEDLAACKITLSISNNQPSHIISKTNYSSNRRLLASPDIREALEQFFSEEESKNNYFNCNKNNISCGGRAQILMNNSTIASSHYYVTSTTHAFLMPKDGEELLLIDLGGIPVNIVYQSESLPTATYTAPKNEKKKDALIHPKNDISDVVRIPKFQGVRLWCQFYEACLEKYIEKLLKTLQPSEEKPQALVSIDSTTFKKIGIYCIVDSTTRSLQTMHALGDEDQSWQLYMDADIFISASDTLDLNKTYVINLSPWYIIDQGSRDRLRVRLHELLIKLSTTHRIILLTDNSSGLFSDQSFVSRVSGFYTAGTSLNVSPTVKLAHQLDNLPLQLPVILNAIKGQLENGVTVLRLSVLYTVEDEFRWRRLEEIIRQIELTGMIYLNGIVYQSPVNNCRLLLEKTEINLTSLLEEIVVVQDASPEAFYLLNPHIAKYGLLKYIEQHPYQIINCHLLQALPSAVWYEVLSQAKKFGCHLFLTSNEESFLPENFGMIRKLPSADTPITISNHPRHLAQRRGASIENSVVISVSELSNAGDLFLPGKISTWLAEGKNVVLYAEDCLDERGDLQQLLTPLLHGKLVGRKGEYQTIISGRLELIICQHDIETQRYFSWIPQQIIEIEDKNVAIDSVIDLVNVKKENQQRTEEQITIPLPNLRSKNWAISEENISPERKRAITNLWRFLQTVQRSTNHLSGLLIEGPSALSKTSLTKQFLNNIGYTLVEEDDLSCCEKNTCFVFKFNEERLKDYLEHAAKYGQIILIDEINSLQPESQRLITEMLEHSEQYAKGFAIIGTLNQGYYPGRESCLPALKEQSQYIQLNAYNSEECLDIFREKLRETPINETDALPEEMVASIAVQTVSRMSNSDAIVRLFIKSLSTLRLDLAQLYAAWLKAELAKTMEYSERSMFVENNGVAEVVEITEETDWNRIKLSRDDFERLYAAGIRNFRAADLSRFTFSGMTLSNADFSAANLAHVNFKSVIIDGDIILTNTVLNLNQIAQLFKAGQRNFDGVTCSDILFEQLIRNDFETDFIFYVINTFYSGVNSVDSKGVTPLILAVKLNKTELIDRLIKEGANAKASDFSDNPRELALYQERIFFPKLREAINNGNFNAIKTLWEENRLIPTKQTEKNSPGHLFALISALKLPASNEEKLGIIQYIVENKIEIKLTEDEENKIKPSDSKRFACYIHQTGKANDYFEQALFQADNAEIFFYLENTGYIHTRYTKGQFSVTNLDCLRDTVRYRSKNIFQEWATSVYQEYEGSLYYQLLENIFDTQDDSYLADLMSNIPLEQKSVFQLLGLSKEKFPLLYNVIHQQYQQRLVEAFELIYQALPSHTFSPHSFLKILEGKSIAEKFSSIQGIKENPKSGLRRKQALILAENFVKNNISKEGVLSDVYMEHYLNSSWLFRHSSFLKKDKNIFGYSSRINQYKKSDFHLGENRYGYYGERTLRNINSIREGYDNTRMGKVQKKLGML